MKQVETDRRSQRTARLLTDALIALMQEKRFDKLTVQDIIDRADVGRSTFYAHYQDKEDLLLRSFEHLIAELSQHLAQASSNEQLLPSLGLFRHIQQHQHLYEALVWGRAADFFFRRTRTHLTQMIETQLAAQLGRGQTPAVPLPIVANHIAGSFILLVQWWLDNELPYSPERMEEMFRQLVMPSVTAALAA
ncbi:MAG: TetR/AcrR family transcriptional regulator [Caldilineaceae bacterium]